jgi:hypothetical protein
LASADALDPGLAFSAHAFAEVNSEKVRPLAVAPDPRISAARNFRRMVSWCEISALPVLLDLT